MSQLDPPPGAVIVVLVRDLMSLGPIRSAIARKGWNARYLRDPAGLEPARDASLLVADLNLPGAIEAIGSLALLAKDNRFPILGFVSHVDAATASAARSAGVTRVLARSAFFKDPGAAIEASLDPNTAARLD